MIYVFFRKKIKSGINSSELHGSPTEPRLPSPESQAAVRRYNNLYVDVPLHNGREWEQLDVADLVSIHTKVIPILAGYHSVSEELIGQQMIKRARSLSEWMLHNRHRSFYMDSDMSAFIDKPRSVAERLVTVYK